MTKDNFFVIAREPGAQNPSIPTWASMVDNGFSLDITDREVERVEVPEVPGAYKLLNVLSAEEVKKMIELSESLGYLQDAAVSLPREVRHNDNVTIVVDDKTENILWDRVADAVNNNLEIFGGKKPLGINTRFRFYRYSEGDYFKFHIDGDWPGSKIQGKELITNAYSDRYSKMTFLILLNEDFKGGETRFLVNEDSPGKPARRGDSTKEVDVRTPAGAVLLFPHGRHPLHCVHSSVPITKGIKYIIRTDMLFEL
ncbi:2OG-Fe(II) oxygenase family protein [Pseudoalteromonas gelatinilytica]